MINMKPSEWCRRMSEEAKDGETAYAYHKLAEIWERKENNGSVLPPQYGVVGRACNQ